VMIFVRYLQSIVRRLANAYLERHQKPQTDSSVDLEALIRRYMSIAQCSINARDGYIEHLKDIGELPLDKMVIDSSRESVYRLTSLLSFGLRPYASLIQITKVSQNLTVLFKSGEREETINIDHPSDGLFHERFQALQENIDKLNFWSMKSDMTDQTKLYLDGMTYVIEVSHQDQYGWSSCHCPGKEGDFRKLCQLFLDLPCYVGSILESDVMQVNASWAADMTFVQPPKTQEEIDQEIETELQALKSKLID
jgi:hypothetical protein